MQLNFARAFETAWQRTVIILFGPFDPSKWFVIGFNVFLASLAQGGVSANNPYSRNQTNINYQSSAQVTHILLHEMRGWIDWLKELPTNSWLVFYLAAAAIYLAVWLVLNWVGCRAQFMVLDNIVRNRAAIGEPWRRYAYQGNVWFPVNLGLVVLSWLFFCTLAAGFVIMNWSWIDAERFPVGAELMRVTLYALFSVAFYLVYGLIVFIIYSFALPLYFTQRMGLTAAILTAARLSVTNPVSVICYALINVLFGIAAGIAAGVAFCVLCCIVCSLALIPILGSMLLTFVMCELILPLLIFIRCFQLDCLAQFGPDYDVFTVDVSPVPLNPQPPL